MGAIEKYLDIPSSVHRNGLLYQACVSTVKRVPMDGGGDGWWAWCTTEIFSRCHSRISICTYA